MKTNRFLSTAAFFAVSFFVANAYAVDFGKIAQTARKASADLEQIAKKFEKLQSDKVKVSEDERGVVLTFSAQLFAVGKADLTDEAKENLQEAAKTLMEYPNAKVEIEGHTDSTGSAKVNQDLSERRAKNVMSFLIELGIAEERLSAVGYGKDRPIADNATETGRAINRRVELVVKEEAAPQEKEEVPEKTNVEEPIRFGIRAGIAAVGVSGSIEKVQAGSKTGVVVENETGFGIGIGGFALIPISSIYFVPELFIHFRDIEFPEYCSGSFNTCEDLSFFEIGIDIPLVFRIPLGETRKFHIDAGPQIGFVILPNQDDRFWEYGITLGAGYRITDNWNIDLRGYYSLTEISDEDYSLAAPLYYAQIGISYIF